MCACWPLHLRACWRVGAEFADPSHYSYWSVASPSSHDTTPVRAWFDADEARRERFFYSALDGACRAMNIHPSAIAVDTVMMSQRAVRSTRCTCLARWRVLPHLAARGPTQCAPHAQPPTQREARVLRRAGRGELPARCTPEVMSRVALQHLASPAVLTILPLQDWLALSPAYYGRPAAEETINDPTNPRHYWRWRMAPTVEDLLEDRDLVTIIRNIHFASGRASPEDLLAAALPPPP